MSFIEVTTQKRVPFVALVSGEDEQYDLDRDFCELNWTGSGQSGMRQKRQAHLTVTGYYELREVSYDTSWFFFDADSDTLVELEEAPDFEREPVPA